MKKLLSVLSSTLQGGVRGGLLFLLFFASVSTIYASDTQVDGIWYDFDSSTKTASVTYQGRAYYSGSVVIPETVTYNGITYSVTSIGDYAFKYCSSLTSITIPESVTSIGDYAFEDCSSLTSVTIPNSVTWIGDEAFYGCSSLTSVTIGDGVTSIGDDAFRNCTSLTKTNYTGDIAGWCNIKFGNWNANPMCYSHNFYINDQEIKDLVIPESVTSIGYAAFYGCSSLTSVTIGKSVTSIGGYAFKYCSSLTSITIPESVTSIGSYAFEGCYDLNKTNYTGDIAGWCNIIFGNIMFGNSYANPMCYSNNFYINDQEIKDLVIPDSVDSIHDYAFYRCSSLTSVTIGESVTSIGSHAFDGCSSLTSVTIGESVTSIGSYAFDGCSSLTSITIGKSVTSIGSHAFDGCSSLTSVTINSDAIVNKAYSSDSNISHIFGSQVTEYIIGESVTSIGDYAFYECTSLTSVTIGESVKSIGECAFKNCSSLTSITIPNSVTSIGERAFDGCSSLTSVTIPNSVISIGEEAFYGCSSLTKTIYIGDIAGWCDISFGDEFANPIYYSENLYIDEQEVKDLVIPNTVNSIRDYTFSYCSSLTSVTIPESVTSIGEDAFKLCSSLTKTNYTGDIAGWCNIKFEDYFANPISYSYNFYINDQEIKDLVIPNSVTSIGDYAFNGCSSLKTVTIPNSVTSIGDRAFSSCSSLTPVTIPNSVTSIGDYAFSSCRSLTSATIGESVTSIGDYAFSGCSSLTSVTIPNSVTSIGYYAFSGCSSLTSVTINSDAIVNKSYSSSSNISNIFGSQVTEYIIGNKVKGIGERAFYSCSSLTSVTIGNSVTSIGSYAFNGCSSLTAVTIPNSVISIGGSAFYDCSSLTKTNYTGDIAGWCNIKFYSGSANPMYCSHNFYINDQEIKDLVIPNSVTSIGGSAFYGCSSLTSVTIPNSVTSIGAHAFNSCSSLTSMTIPNSVTSIGSSAFKGCSSLTSVTIGESVTSIGEEAFYKCSSLTSVTINSDAIVNKSYSSSSNISNIFGSQVTEYIIGESATSIGYSAFRGCSSLTSITCEARTPPTLDSYAFDGVSKSIPVYVPCGCIEAYKAANGWKDFTNIQGLLAEYSIEVNVNDTIMGSAKVDYNTFCEGNQISATPNIGYHFVQWSDGNTDAIRTLELTQDTILTAEFAQSFFGQCGDNLYWSYDETAKTISITGSGKMYDYTADTQPWLLFKEQLVEVTTTNTVTSIGTSAFEGCARLSKVNLGTGLEEIAANAFAGCTRLYDIYVYATYPPFAEESSFANYNVYLYVPCESQRNYTLDVVWGKFKFIECLESEDVTTDGNVTIVPGYNDVTITWPTEGNADTYTIVIKKGNEVFCTLTFNAEGQLLNIAFAPGRNGNHPVQYAEQAGNGYRFTVTGLTEATQYVYNITTKDAANKTIATYSGEFTTMGGTTTDMDNIQSPITNCQKIIRNGQLLIFRDGVEYTIMGAEIK